MITDYVTLESLRINHPAWRLLRADNAPFISAFLRRIFVESNKRFMGQADLIEALEDFLFALREEQGDVAFPRAALDYLNDWADDGRGWLAILQGKEPPPQPVPEPEPEPGEP